MDYFEIKGGNPLKGSITISGSKNSVLPILAATLLTSDRCIIHGVPELEDVKRMLSVLKSLDAQAEYRDGTVYTEAKDIKTFGDYEQIRKMRGSICIMGPLLGRMREANVAMPGGCVIGSRPIGLHERGFQALGADISHSEGYVKARATQLIGANIFLGGRNGSTVLGTANVMMAATLADGVTTIESAACEPEIVDLANFLTKMGAKIQGAGSPTIRIEGVKKLHGAEHTIIPDRIEAATYAIAAAATDGIVTLENVNNSHLAAIIYKLREANVICKTTETTLSVRRTGKLRAVTVTTHPHPGYPTDAQAQLTALMTQADGISVITERIFESRFMHVAELSRMGANIEIEGFSAIVKGGAELQGASVMSSDLRASAALVIAGLMAKGRTIVTRIYHLDRGYEKMEVKLQSLGGDIHRWSNTEGKPNYRPLPDSYTRPADEKEKD